MPEQCDVHLCSKDALFDGLCVQHRKKALLGQLVEDGDTLYDTCGRGHWWVESNIRYEAEGNAGKKRRRCKECAKLKSKSKKLHPWEVEAPKPVRPKDIALTNALESFDKALSGGVDAKCKDRYDIFTDYTARTMPTPEMAEVMCEGCPFIMACGNAAEAEKPAWGVRAGKVWLYGRIYDDTRSEELHTDD